MVRKLSVCLLIDHNKYHVRGSRSAADGETVMDAAILKHTMS